MDTPINPRILSSLCDASVKAKVVRRYFDSKQNPLKWTERFCIFGPNPAGGSCFSLKNFYYA